MNRKDLLIEKHFGHKLLFLFLNFDVFLAVDKLFENGTPFFQTRNRTNVTQIFLINGFNNGGSGRDSIEFWVHIVELNGDHNLLKLNKLVIFLWKLICC